MICTSSHVPLFGVELESKLGITYQAAGLDFRLSVLSAFYYIHLCGTFLPICTKPFQSLANDLDLKRSFEFSGKTPFLGKRMDCILLLDKDLETLNKTPGLVFRVDDRNRKGEGDWVIRISQRRKNDRHINESLSKTTKSKRSGVRLL